MSKYSFKIFHTVVYYIFSVSEVYILIKQIKLCRLLGGSSSLMIRLPGKGKAESVLGTILG